MKKLIIVAIFIVFLFSASSTFAWQVTGTVTSVALWEPSGYCFVEVDGVNKRFKVTADDFYFTKTGLAIALTAYSSGTTVTLNIQDGVITGIILNET